MNDNAGLEIPLDYEFIEFFGVLPEVDKDRVAFFKYEFASGGSTQLIFSVDVLEKSVQIELRLENICTAISSYEGARCITIEKLPGGRDELRVAFTPKGMISSLRLQLVPFINVRFSSLLDTKPR